MPRRSDVLGKQTKMLICQDLSGLLSPYWSQNANAEFDLHVNDVWCPSEGLRGRRMMFISQSRQFDQDAI